uniref:Uncharacterized protein n=1 Tax=Ananas comosus var. bracteatus TaxID=296719 RepID=A0A6V7PQ43_ANACO|nr:unnamed protein product [Ananas comosus var. bracteatus]
MSARRSSASRQPEASRAPSGRVFATQVEEQPAVPDDVVAGASFEKTHGIEITHNEDYWWVNAPEHSFHVHDECLACPVQIGDWIIPIDLLVLERMWGFDVILGINWLSKYYAVIDCESKVITFCEPNQEELVYRACKSSHFAATVSVARARKMIKGGCVAYLATMVEAQKEHPKLSDIRIACEFPDVFPAELKELKAQLQDLLDKCDAPTSQGVTHPRTTPVLARLTLLTSWALPPPKMLKPG